ncbi:MAG: type II secretion system protein [Pseudomonadales bacterium]|nr:type II secretion system protein [Pseudomonadales bacterium]
MMPPRCGSSRGFTLIELVITIVLIGIVSAVALSRMLTGDTFNAVIARDQIISLARAAQQKAIGRSDVVLLIQPEAGRLQLRIEVDGQSVTSASTELQSVSLRADVDVLDSCGTVAGTHAVGTAAPLRIEFGRLGDLVQGGVQGTAGFPQTVNTGMRVCVNGDPANSVCLSATGFAYAGDCDA